MKLSLSDALCWKNRVVQQLNEVTCDLRSNVRVIKGNDREFDVAERLTLSQCIRKCLIALKIQLHEASAEVFPLLIENAELKAELMDLAQIDTRSGKEYGYGRDSVVEYESAIGKGAVRAMIRERQRKMDKNQATINAFNAKTFIEVTVPDGVEPPPGAE